MNARLLPPLSLLTLLVLGACASVPERNVALDQARSRLAAVKAQPQTAALAADELTQATEALRVAEAARAAGDSLSRVDHLAYLAKQRTVIAEETANSRAAQAVTASAATERDRLRLAMRTREADAAQGKLAASEQANIDKTAALAQADATAMADRDRLARREAQVDDLQGQLRELNARQTDRGLVVTLGDLLFSSGQANLQPEGQRSMVKLADFMKRNPQQRAAVEGYTDSVGSTAFNQELSDRRAHAVLDSLVQSGVPAAQLSMQAFGESRPVASNTTASGRQMNRRVEVVFASQAAGLTAK
jgi:outer membrane protein OmpA-like peptidoglycan-associated protein